MSHLLKNLGPPCTCAVKINKGCIGKCIVYDPLILAKKLTCDVSRLPEKAKEYYFANEYKFKKSVAINEFMIATKYGIDLHICDSFIKGYEHKFITNVISLINVLCRTVDGIYIPNKKLSFDEESFKYTLVFQDLG